MSKSALYPRKKKKFVKTKISLILFFIVILNLGGFYLYKTMIKKQVMIIQPPITFVDQVLETEMPINELEKDSPSTLTIEGTAQKVHNQKSSSFNFENIDFTIKNKTVKKLNPDSDKADVLLSYEVELVNKSNKAITFRDSNFNLKDGENEFVASIKYPDSFSMLDKINPKSVVNHTIYFELKPSFVDSKNLKLIISNDSWDEPTTVDLKKVKNNNAD
ncbi:DUF4352 domain-containing protein [Carnobacterium maltaromaticum]|uniref:DUF4352 domain-containing protein n=1 Tax=Carnobacterium maltaromaticum TaxID=2751 RepID=UPI0039AEC31A